MYLETLNSTDLVKALSERRITIFVCVPQFFYLIHQRVMQQVQRSNIVTRMIFRLLLAANFRLRRMGVNVGRAFFGKVHDLMGRDMRLFVTGGSKFDPAGRPRPVFARLHDPPGLRPDRDQRRRDHQHA